MSCKDAMIPKEEIATSLPSEVARDVIKKIKEKDTHTSYAIILDEQGRYLGRFGSRTIIKHLLPKVAMLEGIVGHLDFVMGAEPGFARNLKILKKGNVGDVMRTDIKTVCPETTAIEGMRVLVEFGSPIAVTDKQTGEFFGIITEASMMKTLSQSIEALEEQSRLNTQK